MLLFFLNCHFPGEVNLMKPSMTFRLKNGNILPNAREVSSMIHGQPQEDVEDTINR